MCVLWFLLYIITSVFHSYRWKLFLCTIDGSQRRSHVSTGNTLHNKKSREEINSPVRRTLGFQERASPTQKVLIICSSCVLQWKYVVSYITSIKVLIYRSKINEYRCLFSSLCCSFPVVRHHIASFKKQGWYDHQKVQSSCHRHQRGLFRGRGRSRSLWCNLKKDGSEWPTFGTRHDYWNKAAAFVKETTGTGFQRSG